MADILIFHGLSIFLILVLAGDRINHPLGNVGRMVAYPLKILCDHKHIRCLLAVLYVLIDF